MASTLPTATKAALITISSFVFLNCFSSLYAAPAESYTITELGLLDDGHTRDSDGYNNTDIKIINNGMAVGSSERFIEDSQRGASVWLYEGNETIRLGFTGSDYTTESGHQLSTVNSLNDSGQVTGYSYMYDGGNLLKGSAWFYDGEKTVELGLTDEAYTHEDRHQSSTAEVKNNGLVIGRSAMYDEQNKYAGSTPWLYNGSDTIELGVKIKESTENETTRYTSGARLTEGGIIFGSSGRFDGDEHIGNVAWAYDGTYEQIGLTGEGYIRDDGYQNSGASLNSETHHSAGVSSRFTGTTNIGTAAWVYDGNETTQIGLTGEGYTGGSGWSQSHTSDINEAGQVTGWSTQLNGTESVGSGETIGSGISTWIFNGSDTIQIGLTGALHTKDDGYQISHNTILNDTGQVVGSSTRYNAADYNGKSAWIYNGTETVQIGLTGADNTRDDGFKNSRAEALNSAGQAIGYSERYGHDPRYLNTDDDTPTFEPYTNSSAWLYNGSETIQLGRSGPEYTRSDGLEHSQANMLNEAGQVIGSSLRFDNTDDRWTSQSSWFYDFETENIFDLAFTFRASDNYTFTDAQYLAEDGTVLGTYASFSGTDTMQFRIFEWSMEDGFFDICQLIDEDLTDNDWIHMYLLSASSSNSTIFGKSFEEGRKTGYYAISPNVSSSPVPEPATMFLFGTGLVGLVGSRLRKKKR